VRDNLVRFISVQFKVFQDVSGNVGKAINHQYIDGSSIYGQIGDGLLLLLLYPH
jgi:hypothetical protein